MTISEKVKKIFKRIFRITLTIILVLLGIIMLILVLIQTGPVQNYGRGKIEAYLENKLHTRVRIGNLYVRFPSRIILRNIYLEDRKKDTLLFGGKIDVDISMFRLFRKELKVNSLELDDITVRVKRQLPDSVFNFEFITNAFSNGTEKKPAPSDTTGGFRFVLGDIHLHHILASYADDATGNDYDLSLGDFHTTIKIFDPAHQRYSIPLLDLSSLSGNIRQYKPLLQLPQPTERIRPDKESSGPAQLELGEIKFSGIHLDYRSVADNMNAAIRLGQFHTSVDSIDLTRLHFKLKQIALANTTAIIKYGKTGTPGKKEARPANTNEVHQQVWSVDLAGLRIDSTGLSYDDDNKPALKKGMDYNHLQVKNLQLRGSAIHADPAAYRATIEGISFNERSGFDLKKLSARLEYGNTGASLKDLVIQTDHSEIRNQTSLQWASPDKLSKNPGEMGARLAFDHSRIAIKDLLIFVPSLEGPLKDNQGAILQLNGRVSGLLRDLQIPQLEISGLGETSLAASGHIRGLPDGKKAFYDLNISKLKTSSRDLYRFILAKSLPDNLRLPENMSAAGKFTGTINRFYTLLHIVTSKGDADLKGTLDLTHKSYDLALDTRSLDLGYLLRQDSLMGRISLDATATGTGFEPKTMNSDFHVHLVAGEFKSYNYQNLLLDAHLQNGNGHIVSSMQDEAIHYQLNADLGLLTKYPSVKMDLQLDTLNMQTLHLTDSLAMHFRVNADFKSTDPDALQGTLQVEDIGITQGIHILHSDSLSLLAQHSDTAQLLQLRSEAANIDWSGRYRLSQTAKSLRHFLNRYYRIPVSKTDTLEPENWRIDLLLRPSPLVLALMPSLKGTDSLRGHMNFNSEERKMNLSVDANKIQFNQQVIHQLRLDVDTRDSTLMYRLSVADAGHQGFQIYRSDIYGSLAKDKLSATISLKDKKNKNRYILSGNLSQVNRGMRFVFNPDSLLLNYQAWQVPRDNYIHYDSAGILIKDLNINNRSESLVLNSRGETSSSPLDITFKNFRIKTLSQFAEQDSLLLDGTINGTAEIRDLFAKPLFTSDLKIDTLSYEKDTLGNLVLQVNNKELNAFIAHIGLKGFDNDVVIDGKYFTGESKMDMAIRLNQLNLASFRGLALSQVSDMSGYLKGNLHASGNLDQPSLKGGLHFDHAALVPVITGEPLKISNDTINFDEGGFDFDNFQLEDSAGNKATIDGNVYTKDFKNYRFDMSLNAQNFRVVNAPKEPDRLFYGKLNLNANIDVTGDLTLPKVNAFLRVNKNTDFYVILPSDDPEVQDRNGVVIFVNRNQPSDSARLKNVLDSLTTNARLKGMDVSATIETDSSAQFTLVIDERNGDALAIRGRAELTGGVDKSGKISLTGNYELVNGAYNLTLSVLHRKFDIQRGSTITWTGDPRAANIDITAIYTVNTPPIDLMQQQLSGQNTNDVNKYKQRLPFQVKLLMTGELLKPIIKFQIALPDNLATLWPDVETKLTQMSTDEAEVNKQVFALLLLGRFIQENPFESAAAGTDAGSIARQSASKILGDQLNQLAGSLVKGVDINVDLNSQQDYSTGTATNQTDLNVKVSKGLFDDRIRVTVGSDFQLEQTNPGQNATNLAGDVSVDYKLSKDGRYMLRVYRKDQYQTIVQGQVVETGLSFILTFDYNTFRELFQNKKEPPVQPVIPRKHLANPENNQPAK